MLLPKPGGEPKRRPNRATHHHDVGGQDAELLHSRKQVIDRLRQEVTRLKEDVPAWTHAGYIDGYKAAVRLHDSAREFRDAIFERCAREWQKVFYQEVDIPCRIKREMMVLMAPAPPPETQGSRTAAQSCAICGQLAAAAFIKMGVCSRCQQ